MKDFRKSVINNILFTDIKEHFPLLKKFNALIKDEVPKNEEYINTLTAMIVHTADFGGSAKDFEICKAWSLKVNL
jgi:cAMP-specific phosphodiesterase 4